MDGTAFDWDWVFVAVGGALAGGALYYLIARLIDYYATADEGPGAAWVRSDRPQRGRRTLSSAFLGMLLGLAGLALGRRFGWGFPDWDSVMAAALGALLATAYIAIVYRRRPQWARSVTMAIVTIALGIVVGVVGLALSRRFGWTFPDWDWVAVAALGASVGAGELVSRYRDAPMRALLTTPAVFYISVNGAAAVAALALTRALGWSAEAPGAGGDNTVQWLQVLTAGLGAMALLRSSLFVVRRGDQDVAVGPSTFLDAVLDAAGRAVDRVRAQERAWAVARVMDRIACDKALEALPPYLPLLMQTLSDEEQATFRKEVADVRDDAEASARIKVLSLGLLVMNYMGEGVLQAVVTSLRDELQDAAAATEGATRKARSAAASAAVRAAELSQSVQATAKVAAETPGTPAAVQDKLAEHEGEAAELEEVAAATARQAEEASEAAETTSDLVEAATAPAAASPAAPADGEASNHR